MLLLSTPLGKCGTNLSRKAEILLIDYSAKSKVRKKHSSKFYKAKL